MTLIPSKFSLTDFLGSACESLALDDEEDRQSLNKLFLDKLKEARDINEKYEEMGSIETPNLETLHLTMLLLERITLYFGLKGASAWANNQSNSFRSSLWHRKY